MAAIFESILSTDRHLHERFINRSETQGKSATLNAVLLSADTGVRSLCIWNAGRFNSELLARFTRLERLAIFCWYDDTLVRLKPLVHLRELGLMNFPKVRDLTPLAALCSLTQLELCTAASAIRPQRVASLDPIGKLDKLRVLVENSLWPDDLSTSAIERMEPLKYASLGDWQTLPQIARMAARGHHIPDIVFTTNVPCAKCDGVRTHLMGIASRRKWHCSKCHAEIIAAHRKEFARLAEIAKAAVSNT